MKKILITLTILLTLLLVVSLYNTLANLDKVETVTMEDMYTAHLPYQMPDLILDPMVGFPVY